MKSLGTANILDTGVNTGNIQFYQSAIKGLSAEQAAFALATKGANAAQIEEILTTETAAMAKGAYTHADVQAALAKQNLTASSTILSAEQQKEIINSGLLTSEKIAEMASVLGLSTAENGALVSKKNLNRETVKQKLESIGIIGSTQVQILSMLGLSTAENHAVMSTNLLTAAFAKLWSVISANKIMVAVVALGALAAGIITAANNAKKAREEARKDAVEVTKAYRNQQDSLDSQIKKYKELKQSLDAGSLSANEARSAKEQLLGIQQDLIESYGEEACNLDLVNGKYEEQLGLLQRMSKKEASDYVMLNRDVFTDAKRAMKEIRTYDIGKIAEFNSDDTPKTEADAKLLSYFEKNKKNIMKLYDLPTGYAQNETKIEKQLTITADIESAETAMKQLSTDLEKFGSENNIDVAPILTKITKQLKSMWTEDLEEYRTVYDEFMRAEVIRDDTLRPLYDRSVTAVDNYNKALSSGEDIASAEAELLSVRVSAKSASTRLEGSMDVFNDIFDLVNKAEDTKYQIEKLLDTDESAQAYAQQLSGMTDTQLLALQLYTDSAEQGKEAFQNLLKTTGTDTTDASLLVDKLVELGYVQKDLSEESSQLSDSLSDSFQNLWESSSFSNARNDLEDLAEKAAITKDDITSLAKENAELAALLEDTGISAQLAASCFQAICTETDGFSSITEDARALDQVLHGMDESLRQVADSKSEYDLAMRGDDYNADFIDYQDAYQNAVELFEKGEFGKHFRANMRFLFGDAAMDKDLEQLRGMVENLEPIFGKDGGNGMGFLDELYKKRDVLNGMDSSLEQNPDGTYAFNFEPDEFLRIGEAIGMTAEQVAACTYALGMFGDLHLYRLEELENCLTGISIAAKDGERSVLSLQGIEDMLSWQYDAPGVQEVIQDIRGMEKIELLDFSTEDAASLQALIDRLTELKLLETDGGVIHADSLAQTLQERFGMAANDIEMFLGNLEKTGFMLKDTADGTKSPLPKKHSEQKEQVSKDPKEHTPETAINGLSDDITSLNTQDTENITQEFHNLGKTVGNVSQRVSRLSGLIDEVNGKRISIASSSAAAAQGPSGQPVKGAPKTKKDSKNAGSASAMGNAQVGPAYLSGSIGAPRTETALINELGNETIIDPKTGTYEIVGGGAQFRKIKKGQIILNHLQTKALQTYGRISSFGRMLFSGNARLKGSAYYYGTAGSQSLPKSENGSGTGNTPVSDRNKPDTDPKKSAKETEKAFEQLFHWLERRVKVLQNAWNQWLSQAETALTGRFITNYYKKAQASLKQEMDAYRQSYDIYMNQANASGLGEAYAQKVRDGSLGIESVTDKELADQISSYKEWYEKAEEASEAFAEAAEKLYRLPLDKAADKIERFENSMTLLDKQIQNAVGAKAKNSLLTQKDKKKEKTLHVQEKALKESKQNLKAAAKALKQPGTLAGNGLTKKEKKQLKKDVKNRREIDPSRFKKGSRAYQAAVKYNEALKAKTEAKQQNRLAQEDFTAWKSQSAKLKFDNISDEYEKRLRLTGHDVTKTDNEIALLKASGRSVTESLYQTQKTNYAAELAQYRAQQAALNASLAQIPKGTDEWHDANDKLQQVTSSISDCQTKIYGMNDAILNLRFDRFDELSASISRIREEQEFLQDLFSHEEMTDSETGQFTNAGLAKLASLSASYHAAVYEADRQKALLTQLQQVRAEGAQDDGSYKFGDWEFNSLEQLEEKIEETYAKWQKSIQGIYSLKSSLFQMVEKQSKAELNAAKELIDAKKKALDAEKDLRSYKRSIQEKTSDISSLQKQIDAYSGDTSEEGRARLQKLKNELNSKKEDLEDAEYDRYLSDQKDMLDKLYEDYEESITQKIDDFSAAVDAALEKANDNMDTALGYLEQIAGEYQYGMEFGDLFTQGIKDTVDTFLANLENIKNPKPEPKSDPQESQPPNPNADKEEPDRRQTDSGSSVPVTDQGEPNAASLRDTAKRFIKNHAKNTQKKPEELSAVNKAIYKNKADSYKGTGKILPNKDLKTLATRLGVTYNGEGKKENLYQKLKKIKFPGFQKGGIISVEDIEKQVKRNGDDGIISAKNGEGIIPAELMPQFQEAFKHIPLINNIANSLIDIPKAPMFYPAEHIPCPTHIQATYNFTLENCANAEDMIHQIQHSQKVQKALRSVTLDQLSGSGRLSVKTIK